MNLTGSSIPELQAALQQLRHFQSPAFRRAGDAGTGTHCGPLQAGRYSHHLSWSAYQQKVRTVAAGLQQAGVEPGARIAIMGDVCIEYLLADLAATFVGAIPCGIYPTSSPEEVAYVLSLVGARIFVAEDQEHLDRLLDAEAKENAPLVDKIIICDERALFLYDDPRIELFAIRRAKRPRRSIEGVAELEEAVTP